MGMRGGMDRWRELKDDDRSQRSIPDRVLALRMFRYILSYKSRSALLFIVIFLQVVVDLLPPILFAMSIDRFISQRDLVGLTFMAMTFIAVYLSSFTTTFGHNFLVGWLGGKLEYNMRMDIARHLQELSIQYYSDREVGSIISRATNDIDSITELISTGVVNVMVDMMTLVGIVVVMFLMSAWLSLIALSVIPMLGLFMYFWGRRVRRVYRETRKTIASVSAKIEESVSGMKEIQSNAREAETRNEFLATNASNMEANVEAGRVMSAFWPAVSIFTATGNCLVLLFGGTAVMQGTLTIGILFGFMSYMNRFTMPIQDLSLFWSSVQSALAASERVFGILDTKVDVLEKPDAYDLPDISGEIRFEDLTFGYVAGQPVLNDIDLSIEPNTMVALVGPTGVGKTTMINLLYRFYDPQQGCVKVDGHDLCDVKIKSLRTKMAIVTQDPFLFSGTVMDNIRYGRLDASDEEVIEVARAVGAHEFIERFSEGYDTDVRERGSRLSVGQRQLISLARALLAEPRILIMDEATSSIDAYTELLIQQAMDRVLKGRTAIIIAHRLSTVRNADMIVVLDEGRIAEKGTHGELLKLGGIYAKLYETQFKYQESTPDTLNIEAEVHSNGSTSPLGKK